MFLLINYNVCAAMILLLFQFCVAIPTKQLDSEWQNYKMQFNKKYTDEPLKKLNFKYNLISIQKFNNRRSNTFKLKLNQFSDMQLRDFTINKNIFPKISETKCNIAPPFFADLPPDAYNPFELFKIKQNTEDQGVVCFSSWAYAAAKAIEYLKAFQTQDTDYNTLSAQQLIDCAGQSIGCSRQSPLAAFYYLQNDIGLLPQSKYPNDNKSDKQGFCLESNIEKVGVKFSKFACITENYDLNIRKFVSDGNPVIIEYNPKSFEFIHYASGVFQPNGAKNIGSHFMVVVGYGKDVESNLDYWLVQNSFGKDWGENGLIKIIRSIDTPLTTTTAYIILD